MRVALVICAFNEARLIARCLDAVERSWFLFNEVIVIDNASTDSTARIAGYYSGRYIQHVRVVSEPLKGLSHARQRGYLVSNSDIIAYIDADTEIPRDWGGRIAAAFVNDPTVVAVSGPTYYPELSALKCWFVKWIWWNLTSRITYLTTGYMLNGGAFAIRRETLEKMGGVPMTDFYGEDTLIAKAAALHGKIKFLFNLWVPASARRFEQGGLLRTATTYAMNYLRPGVTTQHEDYR
jgi:glycosyltransferase involved in cell wall biosynthesis